MDPLSIAAGVIAALQAARATTKGVESAWRLRHVSRDFVLLKNEVCYRSPSSTVTNWCKLNDLQCLLLQARDITQDQHEQQSPSTAAIGQHVQRLREHLEHLSETIKNITKTQDDNAGGVAVSYRRWVRSKSRIAFLRTNIVEARNNLSLAISTFL